jgi:hypothetical protein
LAGERFDHVACSDPDFANTLATMAETSTPQPRPKRKQRSTQRSSRQYPAMTVLAIVLVAFAIIVAVFTGVAIYNPRATDLIFGAPPTPTLFVLNPTATEDRRGTLPATWTATVTGLPGDTPTPSATATITRTPTATMTRIPTLTFTPINTLPAGWEEFPVRDAKLAIQFPSTWTSFIFLGRDPATTLRDITQDDAVLADSLVDGLGLAVLDNLIMIAFDTATSGDPYVNNLSIAYTSPADGTTIDDIRATHLAVYEGSDFYELLATDSTTIDGRPAHRIRYSTEYTGSGGTTTVYHLEVITEQRLKRDPLLVITVTTSEERRNIYEALIDRIVGTIRFTR